MLRQTTKTQHILCITFLFYYLQPPSSRESPAHREKRDLTFHLTNCMPYNHYSNPRISNTRRLNPALLTGCRYEPLGSLNRRRSITNNGSVRGFNQFGNMYSDIGAVYPAGRRQIHYYRFSIKIHFTRQSGVKLSQNGIYRAKQ